MNSRPGPEKIAVAVFGLREGVAMADIETWLTEVADALDITLGDVLTETIQSELLDLTGDIAHNVVRLAVPLSSYLMGVAVGRGASPEEAIEIVGNLLPDPGEEN
jgi:hypothetical protein